MRNRYIYIIGTRVVIALLALCCWQGCASGEAPVDRDDPQPPVVNNGRVAVDLALSVSTSAGNSSATTRLAADKVQASGIFRRIQDLKAYALNSGNTQQGFYTNLTQVSGTQHYFSNQIDLSIGTNRFLCYARAIPGTGTDAQPYKNGAVTANYNETDYTQNTFEPVQIAVSSDSKVQAAYSNADAMAGYLTDIAKASSATEWTTSELYTSFISQGQYIAGSSANLKALVTQLKSVLNMTPALSSSVKNDVMDEIGDETNINTKLFINTPYPASIGLPDGAAAVRWNETEKKFDAVTSFNFGTNLVDHTQFVYPPELYYYIDSPIKTATSSLENKYSNVAWSSVLAQYTSDNATVSSSTRSVAVKKALDYAVGCLEVYVKAEGTNLSDNADETENLNVDISTHDFTLTGIILGGQYKQDYQFTPIQAQTPSNTDEKFIYDKEVPSSIVLSTEYLTTTPVYTLAFQSKDKTPVNIVLEFMNYGDAFTGEDGLVHQNTKFYLVGQLPIVSNEQSNQSDFHSRVFTKDYKTTINLNIQSLRHAYNVVPDLNTAAYSIKVDNVAVTPWTDGGTQNHELYNW